jgi:hypothetical protein
MGFDPNKYRLKKLDRYETYIKSLRAQKIDPKSIENSVTEAITNIKNKKARSFVIYGEPQSGKTSMMIGLTAKLLDRGYKLIILLIQDNLDLLTQNTLRFQKSTLRPSPKLYQEVISPDVQIKDREFVVICKKNTSNLKRLLDKVDNIKQKVIIDDEADFASPNSKVNKTDDKGEQDRTMINKRIFDLLGDDGIYMGVTATPIRIDVNRTFNNENHHWVFFEPHKAYKGQDFFFPPKTGNKITFNLKKLPPESSNPKKELKDAVIRFLVNVSYLNLFINSDQPKNYIMLVHTNVRKLVHNDDREVVDQVMSDLTTPEIEDKNGDKINNIKYEKTLELVYEQALKKTNDEDKADKITDYVANYSSQSLVGVLNSDPINKDNLTELLTEKPTNPFTFAIGGNIISRGITFNNLLSMFFTRNVKGLMQQDTYIQRARMFGNRGDADMKHFELTIPADLYDNWHTCFLLHRISYLSAKSDMHPSWATGMGIKAVAPSSIDKSQVNVEKGEMSFQRIKFQTEMDDIINNYTGSTDAHKALDQLVNRFGNDFLPNHIMGFIKEISGNPSKDIALHKTQNIENYNKNNADWDVISRARGILGGRDYEKFPYARHHFVIVKNQKGLCRLFYHCRHGKISFITTEKES